MIAAALSTSLLTGCGFSIPGLGSKKDSQTVEEDDFMPAADIFEEAEKQKEETTSETNSDFVETKEEKETKEVKEEKTSEPVQLDTSSNLSGKHHIEIDIQGMGTIAVELDADSAPITVTNFVKLIQEDFYGGLPFHRVIAGFMMQGGDPRGNGTGGSKVNIKGEFKNNGVENNLSHARGAISMARAANPDSASSQFFIVQTDSHYLDGQYAVFGYVTEGMEIVDAICKAAEPIDNNGLVEKSLQPVMEDIRVMD